MDSQPPVTTDSSLKNAPEHIQLAVDLIQMLEQASIDKDVAIAALNIVLTDLQRQ